MKVKLLADTRILYTAGTELEIPEGEAKKLLLLGFAQELKAKAPVVKDPIVDDKKEQKKESKKK